MLHAVEVPYLQEGSDSLFLDSAVLDQVFIPVCITDTNIVQDFVDVVSARIRGTFEQGQRAIF